MADESSASAPSPAKDGRSDVAKKVAERALGPAADAFGKELAPVGQSAGALTARVGQLLIKALEPLVYGLEKSADWIEKAVAERLSKVEAEKIVPPNPRIAVPAMQALTYSQNEDLIREMFANLLAADMNVDTKSQAHPAFVELVKEMTPGEAHVLKLIRKSAQIEFRIRVAVGNRWNEIAMQYSFELPEGLSIVDCARSLNNLDRLGLVEFRSNEWPLLGDLEERERKILSDFGGLQLILTSDPRVATSMGLGEGTPSIVARKSGIYLTPLGQSFAAVCLPTK